MTSEHYTTGAYLEDHPTLHTEDSLWKAQQIRGLLKRHGLRPEKVCEVGCGAGDILWHLQQILPPECTLEGYDISPQAIAMAKRRTNDQLHFQVGDLSALAGKRYDLLLAADVFEHVEDYYGFLRSARDHASFFIFHIPLDLSVQTVLRVSPILGNRRIAGHLHYFIKETALATLTDTGYDVIDQCYTAGSVELPARTIKQQLARLPRKISFALQPDWAVRLLGGFSLLVLARPSEMPGRS